MRDEEGAIEDPLATDRDTGEAAHVRQDAGERPAWILPHVGDDPWLAGRDDVRAEAVGRARRVRGDELVRQLERRRDGERTARLETPEDTGLRVRHLHRGAEDDLEDLVDRGRAREPEARLVEGTELADAGRLLPVRVRRGERERGLARERLREAEVIRSEALDAELPRAQHAEEAVLGQDRHDDAGARFQWDSRQHDHARVPRDVRDEDRLAVEGDPSDEPFAEPGAEATEPRLVAARR